MAQHHPPGALPSPLPEGINNFGGIKSQNQSHFVQQQICSIRVTLLGGSTAWIPALVLYVFKNHLDLAVLQLTRLPQTLMPLSLEQQQETQTQNLPASHAVMGDGCSLHVNDTCKPRVIVGPASKGDQGLLGRNVHVLGHGLFGPSLSWPAWATHGNICKVCVCVAHTPFRTHRGKELGLPCMG